MTHKNNTQPICEIGLRLLEKLLQKDIVAFSDSWCTVV